MKIKIVYREHDRMTMYGPFKLKEGQKIPSTHQKRGNLQIYQWCEKHLEKSKLKDSELCFLREEERGNNYTGIKILFFK